MKLLLIGPRPESKTAKLLVHVFSMAVVESVETDIREIESEVYPEGDEDCLLLFILLKQEEVRKTRMQGLADELSSVSKEAVHEEGLPFRNGAICVGIPLAEAHWKGKPESPLLPQQDTNWGADP